MKFLPSARYSLLLVTSGLYMFIWLRLLFDELNLELGKNKFNARRVQIITLIFLAIEIIMVTILIVNFEYRLNIAGITVIKYIAISSGILLVLIILGSLIILYKEVLAARGIEISIGDILLIILLTVFMYSSFPFVQQQINSLKLEH